MPITAVCTGCGKQLNVKDEYIGKKLKCPQCGTVFTAAAGAAPAALGASGRAARGAGAPSGSRAPKLHLSPGVITFLVLLIAIPSVLAAWKFGPGRIRNNWAKLEPIARDSVVDVVTRGIQSYLSQHGGYDPSKPHAAPHAKDVTFVFSPMPLSMPQKVGFAGTSTEGAFVGRFFPATGEIEADVELGGVTLPSGVTVRRGESKIKVTGRNRNGNVTVEVDGKKAEIVWPKRVDE